MSRPGEGRKVFTHGSAALFFMHYTDSLSILSSEMGGPGYFAHIGMFAVVQGVGNTDQECGIQSC